jgi:hypothetical protein
MAPQCQGQVPDMQSIQIPFETENTYYKQTSITLLFLSQQTTALAISMESEVNRKSLASQAKVIIRYH